GPFSGEASVSESRQSAPEHEPIGIVISRGRHIVTPPRLSAYIYGLEEEGSEPKVEAKVA
ncbi:MAG TPA: hypothetical protein VNL96_02865, partial [Gemmatimonadaceae bacterium]|nr:hypothetical protein [Gemmatimonadaceae bacterium]